MAESKLRGKYCGRPALKALTGLSKAIPEASKARVVKVCKAAAAPAPGETEAGRGSLAEREPRTALS